MNIEIENNANVNANDNAVPMGVAPNVDGGQFFVRLLSGACLAFSLNPEMTIAQVKEEIFNQQQIPVEQQRLVYQGKQLDERDSVTGEEHTLGYYQVGDNASIHLVLRLRGGMLI